MEATLLTCIWTRGHLHPRRGSQLVWVPPGLLLCGRKLPCALCLGGTANVQLRALSELLWWTIPGVHQGCASKGVACLGKCRLGVRPRRPQAPFLSLILKDSLRAA